MNSPCTACAAITTVVGQEWYNSGERAHPVYHSGVGLAGRLFYVCLTVTLCLPFP